MRKVIEFFIRNSLFGDLLSGIVIIAGIYTAFHIRREIFPNVNFDIVAVTTVFPAASPEEVEKLVTNRIEQELQEVDGIKKIQSSSIEGLSSITVFLDPDRTTAEKGKTDIQDVVDRLQELPDQAKKPVVTSIQSKLSPIIEVSLTGDIAPMEFRRLAKQMERELENLPGVARVVHRGLRAKEIQVEADPAKLQHFRLSLDDLQRALSAQNLSIPGGTSGGGVALEKTVRTLGEFQTIEDVRNTVLRANELSHPIRVRDVALVTETLEKPEILVHTNGKPALSLTVLQKERSDAIDVVDAVRARIDALKPGLKQRYPTLEIDFINDFSDFIRRRLSILTGNFTIGLLLVLAFLPLLIPFRFSLLIAFGEPFAFLGTLLVFYWFDHSINLISMIGLIIVSGILVDDSIVVTENAVRMVDEGKTPEEAAVIGTLQIVGPVTASVLTTTVAFLPMAFMSGIFGKFVREIPIAVITALGVSLFETFLILPAHIAHWIQPKVKGALGAASAPVKKAHGLARFTAKTQGFWEARVVPVYLGWLATSLKRRYWVALGGVLFFVGTLLFAQQKMQFILFPPDGLEMFFVQTDMPVGTSLETHERLVKGIEAKVAKLPESELADFTTTIGLAQQDPNDPFTRRGAEIGQIMVILTPERDRKRKADDIISELRQQIGTPAGFTRVRIARADTGPPTGKPVSLGVRANEYSDILPAVAALKEQLKSIPGVTDIADTYTLGKEEIRVKIRSADAAAALLNVGAVGTTVRAAYEGVVATKIRELDDETKVRVSLPRVARQDTSALASLLIPNPMSQLIPLGSIASFEPSHGLSQMDHEKTQRQVKVTAEVDTKVTSSLEVNGKLKDQLGELQKRFPLTTIEFGGEDEDTQESFASLGRAFLLAMAGIMLILVLTFKNLLQPLVVLLTIPLGIVSILWAFFLHRMPMSFMGSLGVVALAGVIVNNAIVLVDFVNERRRNGVSNFDSIMEAAKTRVRPIFLTTVTTVIGILPTAYGIGGEDAFVVPLALALGWGLLFGSMLTAFVFPAALSILDDVNAAWTRWMARMRRAKEIVL